MSLMLIREVQAQSNQDECYVDAYCTRMIVVVAVAPHFALVPSQRLEKVRQIDNYGALWLED